MRLGDAELAGQPRVAHLTRRHPSRTYQTTQLFGTMSVIDNVLIAPPARVGLANPLADGRGSPPTANAAEALLTFVGYHGAPPLQTPRRRNLPHVDRRLIEIAPAAAGRTRPRVPAARRTRRRPDARRTRPSSAS